MKLKIIPNEQTPAAEKMKFPELFIIDNLPLMEKFIAFCRRQNNCSGLAANQVSSDGIRLTGNFFAIKIDFVWDIVINPRIIKRNGKKKYEIEGCLTWLGKKIIAYRYPEIVAEYWDIKGRKTRRTIKGYEAQVWQHEVDHLKGVKENFLEDGTK